MQTDETSSAKAAGSQTATGAPEKTAPRPRPTTRPPLPRSNGYAVKRAILGPALPTAHLIHERLGKIAALAIFSSDALSSVAYATEEMLKTLAIAGVGVLMFSLIVPLSAAIVAVLAILVFSYRQTIKAYPSAGGAYIVTKDNFGLIPAQVAGVALLTDYVLTVAVSVSAGVAAIIALVPATQPFRVEMAVVSIMLIAYGNLRGVRESGKIFAAPTYVFIFCILSLIVVGVVRAATGAIVVPPPVTTGGTLSAFALVPMFVVLHALASGSTAMTGVEAISNGVPAFKPVEWRHARQTLVALGLLLSTMFLGISWLAAKLQIRPDFSGRSTVVADIGHAVYGSSPLGHAAFALLQIATALILVLAANTAYADFPRLANFHAGDDFLPRQFTTRGHRLVFSNGILALSAAAIFLVIVFHADVTKLIPFYAIGVFTSFTLSQAGMAKRHLRLREPGWRVGLAINGIGAIATGIVLAIVARTKFAEGAWVILILVPVMVVLLVRMNHQYDREKRELERDLKAFSPPENRPPITILLVEDLDPKTVHALQYARTIRSERTIAVHVEDDHVRTEALQTAWHTAGLDAIPLRIVRGRGDQAARLAGFLAAYEREDRDAIVIVPVPHERTLREHVADRRAGARLHRALLPYGHVRVTMVRDHPDGVHPLQRDEAGRPVVRLTARQTHDVVVLVDKLDRATLQAVSYALGLGTRTVRAVHAASDPDRATQLANRWSELRAPVPLDVIECWDREVPRAIERYIVAMASEGTEVTVVMPRRDYPRLRQRLLHDRTSRKIERSLGRYAHIDVADIPYYVRGVTPPAAGPEDEQIPAPV
ncbi:MAG TPA: APC family permease [Actinomycetota bacterium]|jgi:amino acid transporter|nr:APC family permease [Actinomycetota bacterium]